MKPLYLASKSPRRFDLLSSFGINVVPLSPENLPRGFIPGDEEVLPQELPLPYIERIVREKFRQGLAMRDAQGHEQDGVVLAADTVVSLGFQILGKPQDKAEATHFLKQLSNTWHDVRTAVMVGTSLDDAQVRIHHARVHFVPLTDAWIEAYTSSDEPYDKAGGYGIQGEAGRYIDRIDGSFTGIMGLPLFETRELLESFGLL